MRKYKILLLLSVICIVILGLCGCSDTELLPSNYVIKEVEKAIPNSEFVSLVHEDIEDDHNKVEEYGINIYTFNNGDFDFIVKNYMSEAPNELIFGTQSNSLSDDYLVKYLKHNWDDITNLANKYNIRLDCQAMENDDVLNGGVSEVVKTESIIKDLESSNMIICQIEDFDLVFNNSIEFYFYISNYKDLTDVCDFITDFYSIYNNGFPKNPASRFSYIMKYFIRVKCVNEKGFVEFKNIFNEGFTHISSSSEHEIDKDLLELARLKYNTLLKEGYVKDSDMTYNDASEYPMLNISRLVINDEEVNIPSVDVQGRRFFYDVKEKKYFALLSCGNISDIERMTGEYYQKLLLEKYYPNCSYNVGNSEDYISYKINDDSFHISFEKDKFKFYKNNKQLNIDYIIGSEYSDMDYDYFSENECFVDIEDYAMLFGMEVEEIDSGRGIVYFARK